MSLSSESAVMEHAPAGASEAVVAVIRRQVRALVASALEAGLSPRDTLALAGEEVRPFLESSSPGYASADEGLADLLSAEGGCVSVVEACRLFRRPKPVTRQALSRLIRRGAIVAYRSGAGAYRVPVWQFGPAGGVLPGLAEVVDEIRRTVPGGSPLEPFAVLLQEHPLARGRTPLDCLRRGDIEAVRAVVRAHASQ